MQRVFCVLLLLSACESGSGGNGDGGDARDGGDGGWADGLPAVPACAWDKAPLELSLPTAEVKGVLRGASRNASTTCTRAKSSGGPEVIYALRVPVVTVVDLAVTSDIDTVLAIRRACEDPLTELACSDDPVVLGSGSGGTGGTGGSFGGGGVAGTGGVPVAPPGIPAVDAGAPVAPVGQARDARLRVVLDPGAYFVVLDEAAPFGVGGAFTLKVSGGPPPAQSSCSPGLSVGDGTFLPAEQLDVARQPAKVCDETATRSALYYTANVPSGHRLSVRATAIAGDRAFSPVIQLLSGCTFGRDLCLATDRLGNEGDFTRAVRYVNNAPTDQPVSIAISPSVSVSGGTFQLSVNVGEVFQNGTCTTARTVTDGQILRNQDLSEGKVSTQFLNCKPTGSPSLFYRARVLPQQTLRALVSPSQGSVIRAPVFLTLHDGCSELGCMGGGFSDRIDITNNSGVAKDYIVEVSSFMNGSNEPVLFDLKIELPLPPGSISVTPTSGLKTSELGASATFEVALGAPPTAPVTVPLMSSNAAEGKVSPAVLTFDANNWRTAQVVTVTGVDDVARDGLREYRILVGPLTSEDARYNAMDPPDVTVVNVDDEPGFQFVAANPITTSESGAAATFTVTLNKAPTATVRLPVSSSNDKEARVTPAEVVFEPGTWAMPRTVTVTGVDDADRDGSRVYQILTGASQSTDASYAGIDPEDLSGRNLDNDFIHVDARSVSGKLVCPFLDPLQHMATDATGIIYVVMGCLPDFSGGVADAGAGMGTTDALPTPQPGAPVPPVSPMQPAAFVVASADGGKTFSNPVNTGVGGFEASVVGVGPGVALVLSNGGVGIVASRTTDGGASFEAPRLISSIGGQVRAAVFGKRVVLSVRALETLFYVSEDEGRTFTEVRPVPALSSNWSGLGFDQAGALWVAGSDDFGGLDLRKSTDTGKSFGPATSLGSNIFLQTLSFGPAHLFVASNDQRLFIVPLAAVGDRRTLTNLPESQNVGRVLVPEPSGGVVSLEGSGSDIVARRLAAGDTSFSAPKSLGFGGGVLNGVALADGTVAYALFRGDQILVGVETWP